MEIKEERDNGIIYTGECHTNFLIFPMSQEIMKAQGSEKVVVLEKATGVFAEYSAKSPTLREK